MSEAPTSVHDFIRSKAGLHLFLLMAENLLGPALQKIEDDGPTPQLKVTGMDLEMYVDVLSLLRTIGELNRQAEELVVDYWSHGDGTLLTNARRRVMDVLRIAPTEHPEVGRAYKTFAYIYLERDKPALAITCVRQAMIILQEHGLATQVEELLEIVSSRPDDPDYVQMRCEIAEVLLQMETGSSGSVS